MVVVRVDFVVRGYQRQSAPVVQISKYDLLLDAGFHGNPISCLA